MMEVSKCMTTETAHRLCDYVGKCASIHGHSYRWEVTVRRFDGVTDNAGFVLDFSLLKKAMRAVIYDVFDHALVLWKKDPLYKDFADPLNQSTFEKDSSGKKEQKIVWFDDNPTAENFAREVAIRLRSVFDDAGSPHIIVSRVRVWETADSFAEWNSGD